MKMLTIFLFVIINTLTLFSGENEEADVSITLTKPAKFTYDKYFANQVDSLNEMLNKANYSTRNREAAMQMIDSLYKAMLFKLRDSVNIRFSDLYKLKKEIKELDMVFKDKQRIEDYLKRIDFKMDYNYQVYFIKTYEDFLRYYIVGYYSEYIKTVQFVLDSNKLNKSKEEFRKTAIKNKTQFVLNINSINLKTH